MAWLEEWETKSEWFVGWLDGEAFKWGDAQKIG